MKTLTVLLLDDDRMFRKIVESHLMKAGVASGTAIKVLHAESPDEAWTLWRANKVHAIFTDVYLGGPISGIDFLIAVTKELPNKEFPNVILTGLSDDFNINRLWDHGWVVSKPVPKWFWKMCVRFIYHTQAYWSEVEAKANTIQETK